MSCEHLNIYNNELHFLTPYLAKTTWLCLHVLHPSLRTAVIKSRKPWREKNSSPMEKVPSSQARDAASSSSHDQLLNLRNFLYPLPEGSLWRDIVQIQQCRAVSSSPSKQKKQKKIDPYCLRQHLIVPNQAEDLLFTGNSEYPPSFQKEKKGLCGLKINGINSYFNSVIHLLAYVPAMIDIALSVDPNKI